ncbi:MAG TPA: carbon storage regulator [Candidatus Limnocylindrales bacterium]
MLALTRRAGQALRIGETIEVQVLRIEGDRVVLGIAAPRDVPIVRSELLAEVSAETRAAASATAGVRRLLGGR